MLACGHVVLQMSVVAKRKGHALFRELDQLCVGVGSGWA